MPSRCKTSIAAVAVSLLSVGLTSTGCSTDPEQPPGSANSRGSAALRGETSGPERDRNPMPTIPVDRSVAGRLLAGSVNVTELQLSAETARSTVREIITRALADDGALSARAPAAIAQLGPSAVPGLRAALGHDDARHRQVAALTLLGLTSSLHERGTKEYADLVTALTTARDDGDALVATAAKHALRRLEPELALVDGTATRRDTHR